MPSNPLLPQSILPDTPAPLLDQKMAWLADFRKHSLGQFKEFGLPSAKLEKWRYISTSALERAYAAVNQPAVTPTSATPVSLEGQPFSSSHAYFNGVDVKFMTSPKEKGLQIETLFQGNKLNPALAENIFQGYLGSTASTPSNSLCFLNGAIFTNGLLIKIAAGVKLDEPVHLFLHPAFNSMQAWRHIVDIGDEASVSLVFHCHPFSSPQNANSWLNQVTHYLVGKNAKLSIYTNWDLSESPHIVTDHHFVDVKKSGHFHHFSKISGTGLYRQEIKVNLTGNMASCDLQGIHITHETQQHHYVTEIHHEVPATLSTQNYKGVVQHLSPVKPSSAARASFLGSIHVHPHAIKTDAAQSYKALLLSPDAAVFNKPELEIYADDVKCSHGAATGIVDETMVFYLMSRGLSYQMAVGIIVKGFLEDMFNKISSAEIRNIFLADPFIKEITK